MNGYKEDFYSLMHEMVQACEEVRLVEIQTAHTGTPFTPPTREQPDPTRQESPTLKGASEPRQKSKPAKEYVLTRDELEARGMLARGMRTTDIMKAKFGVDTYAPEKVRLRALPQVTTMIRHINRHAKWRREIEKQGHKVS